MLPLVPAACGSCPTRLRWSALFVVLRVTQPATGDESSCLLCAYAHRRRLHALEYVDSRVSGARDRRPALDALLAAVRRREVSAGVVTKLDRMNRGSSFLSF